jgi:predicted transcriptional regulator
MSKGAEYLKISQPTLSKYLKNKGNVETIKGYEPSFSSSIHKDVRESR